MDKFYYVLTTKEAIGPPYFDQLEDAVIYATKLANQHMDYETYVVVLEAVKTLELPEKPQPKFIEPKQVAIKNDYVVEQA